MPTQEWIIVWSQGVITTDSGEVIGKRRLRSSDILAAGVPIRSVPWDAGPGHELVTVGPVQIDDVPFLASLYFRKRRRILGGDILESLHLELASDNRSVTSATAEQVGGDIQYYQQLVHRKTGRQSPVRYSWGGIVAAVDPWDHHPSIVVRYGRA